MASEIQTPLTTENTEITERFQVGPSEAIHSDPRALDPLGQLADVDLILLGRVSLLRILLSVISVLSVVIRSSYLSESSPRLSAPARTCGRGRLARFSLPQRLAVWWVALPWPILPVPAVLLALCRVVDFYLSCLFQGTELRDSAQKMRQEPITFLLGPFAGTKRHIQADHETVPDTFG